jgi:hypothetical protein
MTECGGPRSRIELNHVGSNYLRRGNEKRGFEWIYTTINQTRSSGGWRIVINDAFVLVKLDARVD